MGYLSVDELAAWLRIKNDDRHPELERAITSASADIDRFCGWGANGFDQGAASPTARLFAAETARVLHLPIGSGIQSTSGLIVATDDTDTGVFVDWSASDYELAPLNQHWGGVDGFPYFEVHAVGAREFPRGGRRHARVRITARWGWAAVPAEIAEATKLRAAQLHGRSNTTDGVNNLTGFRAGGRDRDWEIIAPGYSHPDKRLGVG